MPRGKKTVYGCYCSVCKTRIGTIRILKSKKADFRKLEKFCKVCRKRQLVKISEEKHSS